MSRLLRLYPRAWRERYGQELADLLDEVPPSASVQLDLARGALRAHLDDLVSRLAPRLAAAGGLPMPTHPLQRHPTASALMAVLVLAPTALMVLLSMLAYGIGIPSLAELIAPAMALTETFPRFIDAFLLGAPFLALLLAVAPMIGIAAHRVDGELRLTIAIRLRAFNLAVFGVAFAVAGFLTAHQIADFLFERP